MNRLYWGFRATGLAMIAGATLGWLYAASQGPFYKQPDGSPFYMTMSASKENGVLDAKAKLNAKTSERYVFADCYKMDYNRQLNTKTNTITVEIPADATNNNPTCTKTSWLDLDIFDNDMISSIKFFEVDPDSKTRIRNLDISPSLSFSTKKGATYGYEDMEGRHCLLKIPHVSREIERIKVMEVEVFDSKGNQYNSYIKLVRKYDIINNS